jgi:hypothetical protein
VYAIASVSNEVAVAGVAEVMDEEGDLIGIEIASDPGDRGIY